MEFTIGPIPCEDLSFDDVTEESLKEFFIGCVDLEEIPCVPDKGKFSLDPITPMVIHQVLKYEESDRFKQAKIIVLFLGN